MNETANSNSPLVSIIMGSRSDWPTLQHAASVLEEFAIPYETKVVSAHRTPQRLYEYVAAAAGRGVRVVIAGAGGAAHLPGMVAAMTTLPVVAVPVQSAALNGMDSLLSIVQMPRGVAVACQAIGEPGAFNAGLLAAQMLALTDASLSERVVSWRRQRSDEVPLEVESCV